jgi:uncharacterized protein YjbJ (UPF0337 family)
MLNDEQIIGKWDEIKGGIRNLWGNITEEELDKNKGNLDSVSNLVQQKNRETIKSIEEKLDTLMQTFDNDTDKSLKLNDGESSFERSPIELRTSQVSQNQDSVQDIRTRTPERKVFEKKAVYDLKGFQAERELEKEDDEYEGEEIFDIADKEEPTYEPKH